MSKKKLRGNANLRLLDRYLGIPLVYLAGFFKGVSEEPRFNRIAVMKTAAIGDVVLISAVIKDIKLKYPDSHITFFAGLDNSAVVSLIKGVDEVVEIDARNPFGAVSLIRGKGRFDLFFDFGQWPRLDALLSFFSKAGLTIGFDTPAQFRGAVYGRRVLHRDNVHEIENFRSLVKSVGIEAVSEPELDIDKVERDNNLVLVHMFAGGYKSYMKEPEQSVWVKVINELACDFKVVLTGGKSDKWPSRRLWERLDVSVRKNVSLATGFSILETADLLSRTSFLITVNTGIMHMAACLDTPMVAVHGPTNELRWGPLSDAAFVLRKDVDGCPCLNLGFEYGDDSIKCIRAVTADDILDAVKGGFSKL